MIFIAFASFRRFGMIPSYVHIFLIDSRRVYVSVFSKVSECDLVS
jgi:hypothetical protein